MKKIWYRIIILLFALVLLSSGFAWYLLALHIGINESRMILVPRNTSIVAAIDSINAGCNLPTPWFVTLSARITARLLNAKIKSGWYVFESDDTQYDILKALFTGKGRPTVKATIPEGLTYREIAGIIEKSIGTDSMTFIEWCDNVGKSKIGTRVSSASIKSIEGYLMPDTYEFFWKEDASVIGERLFANWKKKMNSLTPSYEDVILASIVQAEAATEKEMSIIAGVYSNRLGKGMKLEADPTVQYGLGQKRRVLYKDLASENPWNTYRNTGLPPTPINNPGYSAVKAAMNPEEHDYLFFVSKGDSSGEHRFAKTSREHLHNVRLYRKTRD